MPNGINRTYVSWITGRHNIFLLPISHMYFLFETVHVFCQFSNGVLVAFLLA